MNFANLNIGTRLGAAFTLLLVLMLSLTMTGIYSMGQMQAKLDHIVRENTYKMGLLEEMSNSVHIVARVIRTLTLVKDSAILEREYKKIPAARAKYDQAQLALESTSATEAGRTIRTRIRELQNIVRPLNNQVVEYARARKVDEAVELLLNQAGPANQAWQDQLRAYIELQKQTDERDAAAAHEAFATARILMLGLSALALVLGALLAVLATRSITQPLNAAVAVAQTVAAGDLSSRIVVDSGAETGRLQRALHDMNHSLQTIVAEVRNSTGTIASATHKIADGNLDLSGRTRQQAASLQDTTNALNALTIKVKQNTESAQRANALSRSASSVATKGGSVVSEVVTTMGSINESSRKIVDIIGVIDSIAFQTNILALNAAVEAARAGEQGRGFAVVASEVRNLAQRSASAAKEIKLLIDDSVEKVDGGSKLVNHAGQIMEEVVSSIHNLSGIMQEITGSSQEQQAGIVQVNQAMQEMDALTRQNAKLVDDAAHAAASLQQQAEQLTQAVSVFKLHS